MFIFLVQDQIPAQKSASVQPLAEDDESIRLLQLKRSAKPETHRSPMQRHCEPVEQALRLFYDPNGHHLLESDCKLIHHPKSLRI